MGYTHYWYREAEIDPKIHAAIVRDFRTLLAPMEGFGVRLGDGHGEDRPILEGEKVCFNGLHRCGHPQNTDISIPWPTVTAGGIAGHREAEEGATVTGTWFAGALIDKRTCNGSCDYETFIFDRVITPPDYQPKRAGGLSFDYCKTAFRPYDLAVTAFLIIAKHHLGECLKVSSDGEQQHWFDAQMLCKMNLGYGLDFKLPKER